MGKENVLDASIVLWISGSCSTQGARGLGFIFIAWISALFLAVAAELPSASYSNCPRRGVF